MTTPLPKTELHFIDGHLIFDNSSLELLRCPRLFYYKHQRRRAPVANKAGRNFGSTLHAGWAVRYRQCGSAAVTVSDVPAIYDAMQKWLDENPQPVDDFRNFSHACTVMDAYNLHYDSEPFEILLAPDGTRIVEHSFLIPFGVVHGIPCLYSGKIDLGISDANGVWSHDHKTAFMFGRGFEHSMAQDRGQRGYAWALGKILGRPLAGYVIDAVRIRAPRVKDEYVGKAPIDASDFVRMPFQLDTDALDEWYEDTTHLIEHVLDCHRRHVWPRHNWQCNGKYGDCDFYEVCSVPAHNREAILASNAFEDDTWSPLKQPDTL